ncbi:MAG: hypothetical protein K1X57_12400 [Gemmataceae bacterium]|nr:hypothetical protein [Gemmataceae bacterium]
MRVRLSLLFGSFVVCGFLSATYGRTGRIQANKETPLQPSTPSTERQMKYQDVPPVKTRENYLSPESMIKLSATIQAWKKGESVPAQLTAFPHYKGTHFCSIGAYGQSVEDYVREITIDDLLKAIILEPKTDDAAFNAALRNVIQKQPLRDSSALFAALLKEQPGLVGRTSFAAAMKDFRSPCLLLKIARYDKDQPVSVDYARDVIRLMQKQLKAGDGWKAAYAKASETMRNEKEHMPGQAFQGPTHLSYAFAGSATPDYRDIFYGIDLRTYEFAPIPEGHLEVLFKDKGGTHILETEKAIWLYHVEEYFAGTAK